MKIGIMGGTFDPIHNGHLMLGEYAYRNFALDQIWFMPNGHPPHKEWSSIDSDAEVRTEMVELAIKECDYFRLETYEVSRSEISCTYQTMEYFRKQYPQDEFFFIIGADSLFAIETWIHPERIFPVCTILAAYRDEKDTKAVMMEKISQLNRKYGASIKLLETPLLDISSHELREEIRSGNSIKEFVPAEVEEFILKYRLYREKAV